MTRTRSAYLALLAVLLAPMVANADLIQIDIQKLESIGASLESDLQTLFNDISTERSSSGLFDTLPDPSQDINAFVQAVLRESYLSQSEVLEDFANKVRYYNELKESMRDRLDDLRSARNQAGDDGDDCYESIFEVSSIVLGRVAWNADIQLCAESVDPALLSILTQPIFETTDFVNTTSYVTSIAALNDTLSRSGIPFQVISVPEPGTLALLGIGLLGMGMTRRGG